MTDAGAIVARSAKAHGVPKALGDFLVLQAVREMGGTCVAVSSTRIQAASNRAVSGAEG